MTTQEAQIVSAAGSIVFAQCVLGREQVTDDVLSEARRALLPTVPSPYRQGWLYGVWNEEFIAEFGWESLSTSPIAPRYIASGAEVAERCARRRDQVNLTPITTTTNELLGGGVYDAYEATLNTEQYRVLTEAMIHCLNEAGVSSTASGGARVSASWPVERINLAKLTEAQCSDRIQFVEKALTIHSRFEHEFIDSHQRELSELQKQVHSRISAAEEVLSKVGIY